MFARWDWGLLAKGPVVLRGRLEECFRTIYALWGVHVTPIEGCRYRSGGVVLLRVPSSVFNVYTEAKDGGYSIFLRGRPVLYAGR